MDLNAFSSLANIHLPYPCRILRSACCPDKDLLVLTSSSGGLNQDRLSLWKIQGSKIWDILVAGAEGIELNIIDVAWSPDGQTIAVIQDPPRISHYSLQDGKLQRTLALAPSAAPFNDFHFTSISWFTHGKIVKSSPIPDMFKREGITTGSVHSILKMLPLLDPIQDNAHKVSATDLFAFAGTVRATRVAPVPRVVDEWPTLQTDPLLASIATPAHLSSTKEPGEVIDEVDIANVDSLLVALDDKGRIHCFLDGSHQLGTLTSSAGLISSVYKTTTSPTLFVHAQALQTSAVLIRPSIFHLPLLADKRGRDFCQLSSTARELCWYMLRSVQDMRDTWYGSESVTGARVFGPQWIQDFKAKLREHETKESPDVMLDITVALATGRLSPALEDLLGSGPQTSERGLEKWENTVVDALLKLRDTAEKRLAPACQRLHLVVEELHGWSRLPQYEVFQLPTVDIIKTLEYARLLIILCGWLASEARTQMYQFNMFMLWMRYECAIANNSGNDTPLPPLRHDIVEVNKYLQDGLVDNKIDRWFEGPLPNITLSQLGAFGGRDHQKSLKEALNKSRLALQQGRSALSNGSIKTDMSTLDRNIFLLTEDLTTRCHSIFANGAGAILRSAVPSPDGGDYMPMTRDLPPDPLNITSIHQRISAGEGHNEDEKASTRYEYLAIHAAEVVEGRSFLVLARQVYDEPRQEGADLSVEYALLSCALSTDGTPESPVEILDLDFFDDEQLILIFRLPSQGATGYIGMAGYNDLGYTKMVSPIGTRQQIIQEVLAGWQAGQIHATPLPIKRARALAGCRSGPASLAVNGRVGRRVACVLEGKSSVILESFDMEGEGDDGDVSMDLVE